MFPSLRSLSQIHITHSSFTLLQKCYGFINNHCKLHHKTLTFPENLEIFGSARGIIQVQSTHILPINYAFESVFGFSPQHQHGQEYIPKRPLAQYRIHAPFHYSAQMLYFCTRFINILCDSRFLSHCHTGISPIVIPIFFPLVMPEFCWQNIRYPYLPLFLTSMTNGFPPSRE